MRLSHIIVALALAAVAAMGVTQAPSDQRKYWFVSIDSLAMGRVKHTHVEVRGYVVYVRRQEDGDVHIKMVTDLENRTRFIIAECIPRMPCLRPRAGEDIILRGITRKDPEHGWWEIHPVEHWESSTAGE